MDAFAAGLIEGRSLKKRCLEAEKPPADTRPSGPVSPEVVKSEPVCREEGFWFRRWMPEAVRSFRQER